MGADLKRREARKRKFGDQNNDSIHDPSVQKNSGGISGEGLSKKKPKKAPSPPSSSKQSPTAEQNVTSKLEVIDESMGSVKHGREEPSSQKIQRFIVFVGLCSLSNMLGSVA